MDAVFAVLGAVRLTSLLLSSSKQKLTERMGRGENAGAHANAGMSVEVDGGGDIDGAALGVAMELAMKTRNPFLPRITDQAITGLSTEFAAHRQAVQIAVSASNNMLCMSAQFLKIASQHPGAAGVEKFPYVPGPLQKLSRK